MNFYTGETYRQREKQKEGKGRLKEILGIST